MAGNVIKCDSKNARWWSDGTLGLTALTALGLLQPACSGSPAAEGGAAGTAALAGSSGAGGGGPLGGGPATAGNTGSSTSGSGGGSAGNQAAAGGGGGGGGSGGAPATTGGTGGTGGSAGSPCGGKAYKLCEDFENGEVGSLPASWTPFKGYEALSPTDTVLSTDQPHGGKMSLKSSSQKRGATRAQKSLSGLGETAYHHWGRIFYKVADPSPKPSSYFHTTFVGLVGTGGENRIVDSVESPEGKHQWLFNIPDDSCCTSSNYDFTFDAEWHCAEWYVDVGTSSYRFFHDSTEVPIGFMARSNASMSQYTEVVVGATYYQESNVISSPFTVWFDDLAIHDERVGCE